MSKDAQVEPIILGYTGSVDQSLLDSLNVEQMKDENRKALDDIGGPEGLAKLLELDCKKGLSHDQVIKMRATFGNNGFPESPMNTFLSLFLGAFEDPVLLILLAAAMVSLGVGIYEDPHEGWIEGVAIFIAVFLVAMIGATNDYTKELQFRALESSSANDQRCSALRNGEIERLNPIDLVVGDILVLQAGDMIPADAIVVSDHPISSNEASLTGEPDDLKKTKEKDCFLLSACLITEGEESRAIVIGIGTHSQWGKIKANLVSESVNTPLQEKLEVMTEMIGYIGMCAAVGTFIALVIRIWADVPEGETASGKHIAEGFINAFILAVTIVVVAIPEGLPLAVTISLAYSTKKMYKDQCFIRVLAACETMGNATNICSDKTGTLTENEMTVVAGYFADKLIDQDVFPNMHSNMNETAKMLIVDQICLNRSAYLVYNDAEGKKLHKPNCIGNKTEGSMIMMVSKWGFEYPDVCAKKFNETKDKLYAFNSGKKRSTGIIHYPDGTVRVYCKGASEWILKDCTKYTSSNGTTETMTSSKREEIEEHILYMANQALRTLLLAHKDYKSAADLPADWEENPPDNTDLICDCVVGIIDPLRGDVTEAVKTAQGAGVTVRMVTGDNIATASAIARKCGILTSTGCAVEGPNFRKMTPKELDAVIPNLQVMARSSPDDKYLLVTRLNGHAVPLDRAAWEEKHKDKEGVTWDTHKDLLLPGYREEWESTRPEGGHVVGVTGDGTNDAPALKAADVGLAMGITGTKVAQGAADIVILDDRFSSIVNAIMWGRCVYDNIRKFLQFQLTVNVVALCLCFIGAVFGFGQPLNAVQMLWVNLVMDTMGALALGTEAPTRALLERRPYKRTSSLISRPMWRNILFQSAFQLILLFSLLFMGAEKFKVRDIATSPCFEWKLADDASQSWNIVTGKKDNDASANSVSCSDFKIICPDEDAECYYDTTHVLQNGKTFKFVDLLEFESTCLKCTHHDHQHGTIIFNAFIFCQFFNEYTARKIFDEVNMFEGLSGNFMFLYVSIFTFIAQVLLVEFGGEFVKTTSLTINQWIWTVAFGFIGIPVGVIMRYFPMKEDPNSFFISENEFKGSEKNKEEEKV